MSHAEDHAGTRRDFLYYATAGTGAVAAGASVWTLIDQMNPSADVRALSSIFVDVSGVAVGTQLSGTYELDQRLASGGMGVRTVGGDAAWAMDPAALQRPGWAWWPSCCCTWG